jgi:hypothetical protein
VVSVSLVLPWFGECDVVKVGVDGGIWWSFSRQIHGKDHGTVRIFSVINNAKFFVYLCSKILYNYCEIVLYV